MTSSKRAEAGARVAETCPLEEHMQSTMGTEELPRVGHMPVNKLTTEQASLADGAKQVQAQRDTL